MIKTVKRYTKKYLQKILMLLMNLIVATRIGSRVLDQILKISMERTKSVTHESTSLILSVPNSINRFRVDSFSSKEPETLEWIDSISQGSVLWDIGANIGLYSCYAAKSRNCQVFAFEPSVFNLELLARNIFLNNLVNQIVIIPIPLSNSRKISTLNMTGTDWGGALSTFGETYGDDGKEMVKLFEFSSMGISLDEVSSLLNIPQPDYIKMDVDGLEHMILSGGKDVLKKVLGLSIEVNEDFAVQVDGVNRMCIDAGLVFCGKRHSPMFDDNLRYGRTYNQIWQRQGKVG
jgi:FkbM family methyltransferase